MKYKPKLECRNVIIVYLNEKLKFENLVPDMRKYISDHYSNLEKDTTVRDSVMKSVSNLKNLFEHVYKADMILYATVHGKLEVDILTNALKPYIIRTGYLSGTKDKAIIPISEKSINKIKETGKSGTIDDLMREIGEFLKE